MRRAVGLVFEDTFLFSDTVRNNIAFADPDASMDARSHEFYVYKNYDEYTLWNDTFSPIIQS